MLLDLQLPRPVQRPANGRSLTVLANHWGIQVHTLALGRQWASRGYDVVARSGSDPWEIIATAPQALLVQWAARIDALHLGLRLGIHDVLPLASGAILVSISGQLLRWHHDRWMSVLAYDGFRKPTRHGLLCDRSGRIYVAQYSVNADLRRDVRLWRSTDGGVSFQLCHTFAKASTRHIHFIQEDHVDGALWLGTGDLDAEVGLYRSRDGGDSWQRVGGGSQRWRAVGLAFTADALWWGTDAGADQQCGNSIVRWDRATGNLVAVHPLEGPAHGVTTLPNGSILFATGVEGGSNESDGSVHLWHGRERWQQLAQWPKGLQPPIMQYGLAYFPRGQEDSSRLFIVQKGLRAGMLTTVEAVIGKAGERVTV